MSLSYRKVRYDVLGPEITQSLRFSGEREGLQVIPHLPIGDDVDTTTFDLATGLLFSSTEDGLITVMHEDGPDSYRVVDTAKTV
jgi:hypothetical protein